MSSPHYADDAGRKRGEALLAAWSARKADPDAWATARDAARFGPTLHPGEILAERYRLLRHVGDGPLAATWSARDLERDEPVGIKVLHGQHASEARAVEAFERAAEAPVAPVPVCDVGGPWQGFRWFAVEGDPGVTVHHAVVAGEVEPATALELVIGAGRALAALHGEGELHGLVCPDVIRIDPTGHPRLHDAGLFTSSAAMGVAWLAPERLDPSVEPGPAADVYGLAMSVLFALNGGELPFWAWRDPERLLDALDPPQPAADALRAAVAWDPADRKLTVSGLLDALLDAPAIRRSLARACLDTGRPQLALEHLDALRATHPSDPDLLADRARALDALEAPSSELAWQEALDAHRTRAQARTALEALVERSRGLILVARGRALLPLLEADERPVLVHRLGRELLADGNGDAALPFLEAALDGGVDAPDLPDVVERLQTERGHWTDVMARLSRRAREDKDPDPLRQAIQIARYAIRGDVLPLQAALLEHQDDPDALRAEIQAVADREKGDPGALLERLARSGGESPADAVIRARWLARTGDPTRAEAALQSALATQPSHLGAQLALAHLERASGRLPEARARYDSVAAAIGGLDLPLQVEVDHARAELSWLAGDVPTAADLWHRLVDREPEDRIAWWGLARAAFRAPDDAPWFGATPSAFTPEEALARLLTGLLDPDAAVGWLASTPRGSGAVATLAGADPRVLCSVVVDELLAAGDVGPAFFSALDEAFGEAALAIEAVRWLWCEPPSDLLFAIPDSYRWTGPDEPFDRTMERRVVHLDAPRVTSRPADWSALLTRGPGPLRIEAAWAGGTPAMAPERANRTVIATLGHDPLTLEGESLTVGGDPADAMVLSGLEPARIAFQRVGASWYLLCERGARVDGEPVTECRVRDGQRIAFEGHTLKVHELAPGSPVPPVADDLLLEEPEWPEGEPHALLLHRVGARQDVLPFVHDALALGPDPAHPLVDPAGPFLYKLLRTEAGYTLEDRTEPGVSELPAVLPLQPGDTFAIEDRTFTFELYGDVTENRPRPVGRTTTGKDLLPLLIHRSKKGKETVIPLFDDVFSVGRGGGNDLQLAGDAEVSRHHCMLVRGTDGACILRDAGSANGTYVNGRPIERHILQVGDMIHVGSARMEFRLGRREDIEVRAPEELTEETDDPASSRAQTAAFRRPGT